MLWFDAMVSLYIYMYSRHILLPSVLNIGLWCSKPSAEAKGGTRICPYDFYLATLSYALPFCIMFSCAIPPVTPPTVSLLLPPPTPLPPYLSLSSFLSTDAHRPAISSPSWSYHLLGNRDPIFRSTSRKRSRIGRITIYFAAVLWRLEM